MIIITAAFHAPLYVMKSYVAVTLIELPLSVLLNVWILVMLGMRLDPPISGDGYVFIVGT